MSNPSMTGDAPEIIAWLHTMVEPDGQIHKFFTWDAKNPWSHWMESYQEQCVHSALPLVPASLITKQADEIERLTTCGVIEVAIRNPSVADYMHHWESRAEKAETRIAALEAALNNAHQLAASARDRRTTAEVIAPAEFHELVEATRPVPERAKKNAARNSLVTP